MRFTQAGMAEEEREIHREVDRLKELVQDGHSKLIHTIRWDRVPGLLSAYRNRRPLSDAELLMTAGVRWERVKRFVDPAIRDIVKRLCDGPVFVMESCSGHPQDITRDTGPYLYIAAADDGCRPFLEALCAEFLDEVEIRAVLLGNVGVGGSVFPKAVCAVPRLSYFVTWSETNKKRLGDKVARYSSLWSRVSSVLCSLDGQLADVVDQKLFAQRGNPKIPAVWTKELKKK